jgi:hypothetical protein
MPRKQAMTRREEIETDLLARNKGKIGFYFRKLRSKKLGKWENWALFILCRSRAYQDNNASKLLELAEDMKSCNQAQISFVDKYTGELFLPKAAAMEREVVGFLGKKIIPQLRKYEKSDKR